MTRQEFIDRLQVELTKAISKVTDEISQHDDTDGHIGWIGEDLDRLMAKAAVAVVEATMDVQTTMVKNGVEVEGAAV
jgi:hypothetical protein